MKQKNRKYLTRQLFTGVFFLASMCSIFINIPFVNAAAPYPDATNTGLTNPGILTPSGGFSVSSDNDVIENLDVTGDIVILANNVTIRNVRITGSALDNFYGVRVASGSVTIEDSEIIGTRSAGIAGANVTARRNNIHGFFADAVKAGDNSIYEDNWMHSTFTPADGEHQDGIQVQDAVSDLIIRHNTITIDTANSTSAIFIANDLEIGQSEGPILIEDNLLGGGGYILRPARNPVGSGSEVFTVRNNRLIDNNFAYDYCETTYSALPLVEMYGNVRHSDSALIAGCNNMTDPDVTAPTVSITSPTAGATVTGSQIITATASDNSGTVARVEFFVDGNLISSDSVAPYAATWNSTTATNGSHTLTAKAYDQPENSTTSTGVAVTVANVVVPTDDGDGIDDSTEDAAPNGGDGNGDGTADSQQDSVASYVNSKTGTYNTLAVSGQCDVLQGVASSASTATFPTGVDAILGQLSFSVDCNAPGESSNVTIFLDKLYDQATLRVYKVGASGGVAQDITSQVTLGAATVGAVQLTTVSYALVDGGSLDEDGLANGTIVDPVAIGTSTAPAGGLADTGSNLVVILGLGGIVSLMGVASFVYVARSRGIR